MPSEPEDLLTVGVAAQLLGVTADTLRRWTTAGEVAVVRTLGGHRRYRRADIEALLGRPQRAAS